MNKKMERKELLWRILIAIVSGIILYAWTSLVCLLVLVSWIIILISGKRNKELGEFIEYYATTTYQFIRYVSGITNKRPFPFGELTKIGKFEN